jgi:hypothetical protein
MYLGGFFYFFIIFFFKFEKVYRCEVMAKNCVFRSILYFKFVNFFVLRKKKNKRQQKF